MTVEFELVRPLFQPLRIRKSVLPNRIVMAPMTRNFSPGGVPGPDVAAYYRRRAEGGTALIITEGVGIDHPAALGEAGLGEKDIPEMHGKAALTAWTELVKEVHTAGGLIFPQLWHQGVMRVAGTGRHPEVPSCSPSGIWGPIGRPTSLDPTQCAALSRPSTPMTENDIADVISAYGRSAGYARQVGFDGIAIHGAHGYLIDTFLWGECNLRTDRWGGDLVRRSRFGAEVVKAIRAAVGDDLPIVFRFSQWKQQDFRARLATTPQELETVLGPISDAGVDVFDASVRYFNRPEFKGSSLNLAGWTRRLTGKLSMAVGGIGLDKGYNGVVRTDAPQAVYNFEPLIERFNNEEFDLVEVGRALLNDPDWAQKLRRGEPHSPFSEESLKVLR